jgi:ferredoxin-NADP reductase
MSAVSASPAYREVATDLVVLGREEVAEGVVVVTLGDPGGAMLPTWGPGAHVDLVMAPSLVRQYSLCGNAGDRTTWKVGVLLDPESRGGSRFVHESLGTGSTIRVVGPRNHFPLVGAPRYQFIAGGIGITPLLPMIEAAEARGADWNLLYGGRARPSMAFLDVLAKHPDRVTVSPRDERDGGLDLASVLAEPRDDTLVYCCGPEGLLSAVNEACSA